ADPTGSLRLHPARPFRHQTTVAGSQLPGLLNRGPAPGPTPLQSSTEEISPMAYELPPLPYDYAALEPYIDAETMKLHHDKHHQAYINNVNAALEKHPELAQKSVDA